MTKLTSAAFAAAAVILLASAFATAGETTPQTGFAAVAQIPVTALSSSEMAETRGGFVDFLPKVKIKTVVNESTDPWIVNESKSLVRLVSGVQ